MPATGFTALVRRSDVIELNLTLEQAVEYIVSCGVVVPVQQQARNLLAARLTEAVTAWAVERGGAGAIEARDAP